VIDAQGFLDTVAGYTRARTDGSADKPLRLAVVDPAYSSGLPRVTFEGESTLSGRGYAFLESYYPTAGDRVALVPAGTTYLIIGAVDGGTPANNAGYQAARALAVPHSVVTNGAGSTTMTSATNVDLGVSATITKLYADTVLAVDLSVAAFSTATNTEARFAVRVNSVDTDVFSLFFNPASQHMFGMGSILLSGVPVGSQAVTVRWRRLSGTGTLTRNSSDWHSLKVTEQAA
jgi:hypothetical protein